MLIVIVTKYLIIIIFKYSSFCLKKYNIRYLRTKYSMRKLMFLIVLEHNFITGMFYLSGRYKSVWGKFISVYIATLISKFLVLHTPQLN